MSSHKVAFLTAGGLAPCLSSTIGFLVEAYQKTAPDAELIAYRDGYKGLLLGDSFTFSEAMRKEVGLFQRRGGSPIETAASSSPTSMIASNAASSKMARRLCMLQQSN